MRRLLWLVGAISLTETAFPHAAQAQCFGLNCPRRAPVVTPSRPIVVPRQVYRPPVIIQQQRQVLRPYIPQQRVIATPSIPSVRPLPAPNQVVRQPTPPTTITARPSTPPFTGFGGGNSGGAGATNSFGKPLPTSTQPIIRLQPKPVLAAPGGVTTGPAARTSGLNGIGNAAPVKVGPNNLPGKLSTTLRPTNMPVVPSAATTLKPQPTTVLSVHPGTASTSVRAAGSVLSQTQPSASPPTASLASGSTTILKGAVANSTPALVTLPAQANEKTGPQGAAKGTVPSQLSNLNFGGSNPKSGTALVLPQNGQLHGLKPLNQITGVSGGKASALVLPADGKLAGLTPMPTGRSTVGPTTFRLEAGPSSQWNDKKDVSWKVGGTVSKEYNYKSTEKNFERLKINTATNLGNITGTGFAGAKDGRIGIAGDAQATLLQGNANYQGTRFGTEGQLNVGTVGAGVEASFGRKGAVLEGHVGGHFVQGSVTETVRLGKYQIGLTGEAGLGVELSGSYKVSPGYGSLSTDIGPFGVGLTFEKVQ